MEYIWENYWLLVKNGSIIDLIDVAIVAFLVYHLIRFVHNTNAERLIKGVIILLAVQFFASTVHLNTISFVLEKLFAIGIVACRSCFSRTAPPFGADRYGACHPAACAP